MEVRKEWIARLVCGEGEWLDGRICRDLRLLADNLIDLSKLESSCDDNGNFSEDGSEGRVDYVVYRITDTSCPHDKSELSFSFRDYVYEFKRSKRIKITKIKKYEPIDS
jgi:hypothetical protein